MTDTHRQLSNERILNLVDDQVAQVEAEIRRLGTLQEDLHASGETIEKLNAENAKLRSNPDILEKAKRMPRLRDNAALIDMEQGDARKIEANIKVTKTRVVALGQIAKSLCSEILWSLSTTRRVSARALLENILDFSLVGAIGQNLEVNARSVLVLKELEFYFGHSGSARDPEYHISSLGQLRANFSALRTLCENEPDLVLPPTAAPKPVEEAVPEYQPAVLGNKLGSLADPVLA